MFCGPLFLSFFPVYHTVMGVKPQHVYYLCRLFKKKKFKSSSSLELTHKPTHHTCASCSVCFWQLPVLHFKAINTDTKDGLSIQ